MTKMSDGDKLMGMMTMLRGSQIIAHEFGRYDLEADLKRFIDEIYRSGNPAELLAPDHHRHITETLAAMAQTSAIADAYGEGRLARQVTRLAERFIKNEARKE